MWDNFRQWLAQPFSAEQDAMHWFLFVGMLIVIMVLWRFILGHILKGIE